MEHSHPLTSLLPHLTNKKTKWQRAHSAAIKEVNSVLEWLCRLQALVKAAHLSPNLSPCLMLYLNAACSVVCLLSLNATYFKHASTTSCSTKLTHYQPNFPRSLTYIQTARLFTCLRLTMTDRFCLSGHMTETAVVYRLSGSRPCPFF